MFWYTRLYGTVYTPRTVGSGTTGTRGCRIDIQEDPVVCISLVLIYVVQRLSCHPVFFASPCLQQLQQCLHV